METVTVSSVDEFLAGVDDADQHVDLDDGALGDVWALWTKRYARGAEDYLVAVPDWLSEDKFDARRPFFFAKPEYDDPDKGAVLFTDVHTIDSSIMAAGMYDEVSVNEVVELVDISAESAHTDDAGTILSPRSQQTVFEYGG